jgi:hypothetical protein
MRWLPYTDVSLKQHMATASPMWTTTYEPVDERTQVQRAHDWKMQRRAR